MRQLRLAVVLLAVILTTCVTPMPPAAPHPGCHSTVAYELDPRFDNDQVSLILRSMRAWDEGTGGYVCFVQGSGGIKVIKADQQPLQREVELKGAKYNHVDPDLIVGLAEYPKAYILTGKLHTEQDFYATSIHEVGHLLGMDHYSGPDPSWMYPCINLAPGGGERNLTERDSRAYCESHGCYRP